MHCDSTSHCPTPRDHQSANSQRQSLPSYLLYQQQRRPQKYFLKAHFALSRNITLIHCWLAKHSYPKHAQGHFSVSWLVGVRSASSQMTNTSADVTRTKVQIGRLPVTTGSPSLCAMTWVVGLGFPRSLLGITVSAPW